MLWDPIRYFETCPSSDGACAMVLTERGRARRRAPQPPAWVHGTAMRSEPTMFAGRDQVQPAGRQGLRRRRLPQAGITDPRREIDCAEIYVPFSWYEPMWLENLGFAGEGEGWKLTEDGATALDGDIPVNPSGGVLSSNPIGASGMIRFAEAALQVRGQAGEHQVDGARTALGHAYGGGSQFFAMWVVGERQAVSGPRSTARSPSSRGRPAGQGEAEARRFVAEGAHGRPHRRARRRGRGAGRRARRRGAATATSTSPTRSEWQAAVAAAEERFGPLNVLVNNAGILDFAPDRQDRRRRTSGRCSTSTWSARSSA